MPSDARIIYRILKALDESLDYDDGCDPTRLTADALGTTDNRLRAIWAMLSKNGYVEGVIVREYASDSAPTVIVTRPRITLKGVEYLSENSMMRKAAQIAIGIAENSV